MIYCGDLFITEKYEGPLLSGSASSALMSKGKKMDAERYGVVIGNEPVRGKTNNLGSDHVRHKPGCTVAEDD